MPCPTPQHTHFRRGTLLHVPADRGGMVREKVTNLIRRVLVGVLVAPCPQFCKQGLTTFLHMGGTGRAVVPLHIVEKCAAYGADIVHFRHSWTGKVHE